MEYILFYASQLCRSTDQKMVCERKKRKEKKTILMLGSAKSMYNGQLSIKLTRSIWDDVEKRGKA